MSENSYSSKEIDDIERELALIAHERNHQMHSSSLQGAIESASSAMRTLALVNGGTVVALLAFLGSIEAGEHANSFFSSELVCPILLFAVSLGLSLITSLFAYLVNATDADIHGSRRLSFKHPYVRDEPETTKLRTKREWYFRAAMGTAIASLAFFFLGIITVANALMQSGI